MQLCIGAQREIPRRSLRIYPQVFSSFNHIELYAIAVAGVLAASTSTNIAALLAITCYLACSSTSNVLEISQF